jgi:hypothetical protein
LLIFAAIGRLQGTGPDVYAKEGLMLVREVCAVLVRSLVR